MRCLLLKSCSVLIRPAAAAAAAAAAAPVLLLLPRHPTMFPENHSGGADKLAKNPPKHDAVS